MFYSPHILNICVYKKKMKKKPFIILKKWLNNTATPRIIGY